jgi:hypothetical protein
VINPESAGKDRTRLSKSIVLSIRELMRMPEPNDDSRDMAAYIALALAEIAGTIEPSVAAWEKRDYWVKADRFRMEWAWAGRLAETMRAAVLNEDWGGVAAAAMQIAQKLGTIKIAQHHRLGTPWVGAYAVLKKQAAG